ncbi:MAG: protein kinase domain-containing protein, partial [Planctomycetaceae bacterium]
MGISMEYHHTPSDDEIPFQETRAVPLRVATENLPVPQCCHADEAEDDSLRDLLPPSLRGEYSVLAVVSKPGKYPLLLKVRPKSLRQLNAVKVWSPNMTVQPGEGGIQEELSSAAGAAGAIRAVPRVQRFAMCPARQQWYLVMSWIPGTEAGAVAGDSSDPLYRNAVLHFAALAEDLQLVHTRGYLHGDISPRNVLWSPAFDFLTLLDYGNAGRGPCVQLDRWTPGFVAPELQVTRIATVQTEVWALAALLVHVLCGVIPDDKGQLPGELNAGQALRGVLLHALHPEPVQRYRSCGEFAAALRRAAARRPAELIEELRTREDCLRARNRWFPGALLGWESGGRGGSVFRRVAPGRLCSSSVLPAEIQNAVPFHVMGEPLRLEDFGDMPAAARLQRLATVRVLSVRELQMA